MRAYACDIFVSVSVCVSLCVLFLSLLVCHFFHIVRECVCVCDIVFVSACLCVFHCGCQ